jgi:hypothetical protein
MKRIFQTLSQKWPEYLLEILVLIIGIYGAFVLDNWNEKRKDQLTEQELFIKLKSDLEEELVILKRQKKAMKSHQDLYYTLYESTKQSSIQDSTQDYNQLQWISTYYHPSIYTNYLELITSISNLGIRDKLRDYFKQESTVIKSRDEYNSFKTDNLRPYFSKHGIHNTEAAFNEDRYSFTSLYDVELIDYPKLKSQFGSSEFDELLFDLRFKASWMIHCLDELELINNELQNDLTQVIR